MLVIVHLLGLYVADLFKSRHRLKSKTSLFRADGAFIGLPAVPVKLLERSFRASVLDLLVAKGEVTEQFRSILLAWRHSGFSVHNAVRVGASDAQGRKKLAQYMLRAPFSLEKMSYDDKNGTVIYRSHMHKILKRNFQVMPGAKRGRIELPIVSFVE